MIVLIVIGYFLYMVGISLQIIDLKLNLLQDIWAKARLLGIFIALDITSLLFFGTGGFLLFYQVWLFASQVYLRLKQIHHISDALKTLLIMVWGLSLTLLGNFLLGLGSLFFSDSLRINSQFLFTGAMVTSLNLAGWILGAMIRELIKQKRASQMTPKKNDPVAKILWVSALSVGIESISMSAILLISPHFRIDANFSAENFLLAVILFWGLLSTAIMLLQNFIKGNEKNAKEKRNKWLGKRSRKAKVDFELGEHDLDSIFYRRDDSIDKKLAQNPEIFLKGKHAVFDRSLLGTEVKKPLYVRFDCPHCKRMLSMGMMCHLCKIRICPQCLAPVPIDTSVCVCGYTFTSISRIVTFSKNYGTKLKKGNEKEIPIRFIQSQPHMDVNTEPKSVLRVDPEKSKQSFLAIKGESTGTRFCPICHIMGWREEICQCGYNYKTKKLEGKKIADEKQ